MAILDKEFLTFCNAANLDWQYASLVAGRKLHELLSPEKFVRKYDDGRTEDVYKNISEMQNSAGVLMNYLEECGKNSCEGDFLKNWEVVYGADSYKLYTDYLDEVKEITKVEINYPSREKVESSKKINFYIDIFINVADGALYIYSGYASLKKIPIKMDISKNIKKQVINDISDSICEKVEVLNYANIIRKDKNDRKKITGKVLKSFSENRKKESSVDVDSYIKLTRKIDFLSDSNFKVVIFKSENLKTVVVAFGNLKYIKNETLPEEIDLIQIVINKVRIDFYKDYKIVFTGYNSGADFGILSNILAGSIGSGNYFYSEKLINLKEYINFTEKDISEKFKSVLEIGEGKLGESAKEIAITSLFFAIEGVAPVSYLYFAAISLLKSSVKFVFEWFESISAKINYYWLKDKGYIMDLTSPNIKGYITEKIYSNNCMLMTVKNIGNIKVNLKDAIFLDMTRKNTLTINKLQDNSGFYIETLEDIVGNIYEGKINSIIYLKKQINDFYGISNIIIEDSPNLTVEKEQEILKKYDEGLKKVEYMIANMKIVGKLQREWKKLKNNEIKNSTYVYVNNSIIERVDTFPTQTPVYFNIENSKYLNEHIFLPYITKEGNIGDSLRDDYIKNALKDGIKAVLGKNAYAFNSKAEIKKEVYKAFKNYSQIRKDSLTSNGTNYDSKIEVLPIYFYNEILDDKDKFDKCYKVDNSGKNYMELQFEQTSSEMRYGFNPKAPLTRKNELLKIAKNMEGLKFNDIIDIILPPIKPQYDKKDKKCYVICDIKALDSHINKSSGSSKLSYKGKYTDHGYVVLEEKNTVFKQNYYTKKENVFGSYIKEGSTYRPHYGVDFSYGRENPICCSHPPVHSPVNGEKKKKKNGRVIIKNTEIMKKIKGKEIAIPYYHIIEHLHDLKVIYNKNNPTMVKKGTVIGTMGGTSYKTGNKYEYLQHIHYGIMVNNKYFTGTTSFTNDKSSLNASEYDRLINPEEFWDKGNESGSGDYKTEKTEGAD